MQLVGRFWLGALAVLGAGGLGVGLPRPPSTYAPTIAFTDGGDVKSTFDAVQPGTVVSARWVTIKAGVGAGNYTATLEVNTIGVCTITVGCADVAGTEVTASCNDAFVAGDDIDWVGDGSACSAAPVGNLTYVVQAP